MLMVDLFDIYDKVEQGLVESKHLDFRVHTLRTGIFRSPIGLRAWVFWEATREKEFVEWFENNIIDQKAIKELVKEIKEKIQIGKKFLRIYLELMIKMPLKCLLGPLQDRVEIHLNKIEFSSTLTRFDGS